MYYLRQVFNQIRLLVHFEAGGSFKGMIWGLFFTIILIQFVGFVLMMVLCYALAYAMYRAFELKPTDKESVVIVWVTSLAAITSAVYLYCPNYCNAG